MTRLGMSLVITGVMLGVGCGGSNRPAVRVDAGGGGSDAGGGGGGDAGIGSDAGGGGTDAGTASGCMIPMDFSDLPADCVPRCSAATRDTFYGCTTTTCQSTAAMSDTTPPITVGGSPFTCANCVNYGQNSCIDNSCPTEFEAYLTCSAGGGMCMTEIAAVNTCVMAHMAAISACANPRVQACFPPAA